VSLEENGLRPDGLEERAHCATARCVMERADTALYEAKHGGRDRVAVATA
jgi:PleD family two-component response regulator